MDSEKIPYIAFEAEMARHERTIKRLLIAFVVSVALITDGLLMASALSRSQKSSTCRCGRFKTLCTNHKKSYSNI